MQIWPAIDLLGGKCVRLQQGDYARETVFSDDPVAIALQFQQAGARYLHLVDLDGARSGKPVNTATVRAIVEATNLECELGGGIRDQQAILALLELGLQRVILGTAALKNPAWFRQMCHRHPGRLVLGIDARDGWVATEGWLETSDVSATELAREFEELPLAALIYTDIAKDGMMAGPNVSAMTQMQQQVKLPVIASGGVTTAQDVSLLASSGVAGAIIGRALYEGTLSLTEALQHSNRTHQPEPTSTE